MPLPLTGNSGDLDEEGNLCAWSGLFRQCGDQVARFGHPVVPLWGDGRRSFASGPGMYRAPPWYGLVALYRPGVLVGLVRSW
ncbi:hypothetical protein ACM01_05105 [Streptomyces viridochromogenes]|uniref:Uncharacterized protein n=1 Tax=Streptomyces viridochromogenes TaxID=1938 RepID=A0A0J7ZME8_STRVR|nr:hypothetical protein ACM01_05105 [Streptomyces viridochromogenes]KOG23335.1 hypothetical protein ADK35_13765 [Streptomyces viridochromogenes]KOG27059.1 hypothetical protein ADK36_00300 [Streptomyces viridochromogenes]